MRIILDSLYGVLVWGDFTIHSKQKALSGKIRPLTSPQAVASNMAQNRSRITAPELEQFVVANVQLTGVTLGAGAYGSVEEVDISGARVAAKKLHPQLINLGSPQQVQV